MNAFLLGPTNFFFVRQHVFSCFQAGQVNVFGSQPAGCTGTVKRHVTAAQYNDPFAHAGIGFHGGVAQKIGIDQHTG